MPKREGTMKFNFYDCIVPHIKTISFLFSLKTDHSLENARNTSVDYNRKNICNANKCGDERRNKLLFFFVCTKKKKKETQESPFRIKKEGNVIPQKLLRLLLPFVNLKPQRKKM